MTNLYYVYGNDIIKNFIDNSIITDPNSIHFSEKEIGNIAALLFDKERLQEMKENMKNIVDRIEEDKMLEIIERLRLELSQQAEDEKRLRRDDRAQ